MASSRHLARQDGNRDSVGLHGDMGYAEQRLGGCIAADGQALLATLNAEFIRLVSPRELVRYGKSCACVFTCCCLAGCILS